MSSIDRLYEVMNTEGSKKTRGGVVEFLEDLKAFHFPKLTLEQLADRMLKMGRKPKLEIVR